MDMRTRGIATVAPAAVAAFAMPWIDPIAQDPHYHAFADQRFWCGVANGQNVWSNALFLVAGLLGLFRTRYLPRDLVAPAVLASVFLALTALGSAFYHHAPGDASLVWDRLPLAVAIMALLVLGLTDRFDARVAAWLAPAALAGAGSVAWWAWFGDLRPYALVQFGGLVTLILLLVFGRRGHLHPGWWCAAIGAYIIAKACELGDSWVWIQSDGTFAGHMLKHVVSGLGAIALVLGFGSTRSDGHFPRPREGSGSA